MMISIKSASSNFSRASPEMLFLVTCTMQSIRRLCEVAYPLAAFGGSMYPCSHLTSMWQLEC